MSPNSEGVAAGHHGRGVGVPDRGGWLGLLSRLGWSEVFCSCSS